MAVLTISGIAVEVQRKNIKHMHLYVKPPNSRAQRSEVTVTVSAPLFTGNRTIERFVQAKMPWIHKQMARVERQSQQALLTYVTGETLYVWGKPYRLRVEQGSRNALSLTGGAAQSDSSASPSRAASPDEDALPSTTTSPEESVFSSTTTPPDENASPSTTTSSYCSSLSGTATQPANEALLILRKESTTEQRERFVKEWYRELLKAEVPGLLAAWEEVTGLKATSWQTKYMTSRWGTCNTKTGKIWLNVQLATKAPECLRYVILHELVHLVERGHGVRFKALMSQYLPEWREIKALLNGRA